MKKVIYLVFIAFIFISCSKERFENTGDYMVKYNLNIEVNGEVSEVSLSRFVSLRNETKNSIEFDNNKLIKRGLKIEGRISREFIFGTSFTTDSMDVILKRDFFGDNINGTLTTMSFFAGDLRETIGTIEMIPN